MPASGSQNNSASQGSDTGSLSHTSERAAAKQREKEHHDTFIMWVIAALVNIDKDFGAHEDALEVAFRVRLVAQLGYMQRWLRRHLQTNERDENREALQFSQTSGGDEWEDIDMMWQNILIALMDIDEEFGYWEDDLYEIFDGPIRNILEEARVWLRRRQRGIRD